MDKLKYLLWALSNNYKNKTCPACGAQDFHVQDRKFIVTRLLKCENCHLQYRFPTDNPEFNEVFYQSAYSQSKGVTTNLPSDDELQLMISNNFRSTDKNADRVIKIINELFVNRNSNDVKVVDYGCSWGYISYQLKDKGLLVESYEISKPRASFGNLKLKLNIKTNQEEINDNQDLFFSSHVIEHHPNPTEMIQFAKQLIKREGYFVCYCPNGSEDFYKSDYKAFHRSWGLVHPFYLSKDYFMKQFVNNPFYIGSNLNLSGLEKVKNNKQHIDTLDGNELLVISKPNIYL